MQPNLPIPNYNNLCKKERKWYAVYTRSRYEKKVAAELTELAIEHYLPLHKRLKQWSDRKKWVEEPLIRSYIFVKNTDLEFFTVCSIPGVVRYVSFEGRPAVIPEEQVNYLKLLLTAKVKLEVTAHHFVLGEKVRVTTGPLIGLRGEIVRCHGVKSLLVRIDHIGQSVLVKISSNLLEKAS